MTVLNSFFHSFEMSILQFISAATHVPTHYFLLISTCLWELDHPLILRVSPGTLHFVCHLVINESSFWIRIGIPVPRIQLGLTVSILVDLSSLLYYGQRNHWDQCFYIWWYGSEGHLDSPGYLWKDYQSFLLIKSHVMSPIGTTLFCNCLSGWMLLIHLPYGSDPLKSFIIKIIILNRFISFFKFL